ncbi:type III secretion system inner rod subunit SctI [Robbsia sp. Bb-Pol-6]|uniref:Type III secretion system inner rod subunit SctI n=1 Tax=Robbsia betulipollinis TaxID=2981849 RepID=A0ABT3ZKZ5_9BURK|nr:type III secretion system inner rod subunit SctI [Robbsia betulipollinis]MCY0387208.1 type III secretion system inner rod subunit SctI [Robbsia betulipollinis]
MKIVPIVASAFSATAVEGEKSLDVALRSAVQNLTDDMISSRNRIDSFMQTPNGYSNPAALAAFQVELANYSINNAVVSGVVKRLTSGVETLVKG